MKAGPEALVVGTQKRKPNNECKGSNRNGDWKEKQPCRRSHRNSQVSDLVNVITIFEFAQNGDFRGKAYLYQRQ